MSHINHLLIFVGCCLVHIQCQTICKKDQYTIINSNGSVIGCLNCETCHPGRGLHPPCGEHIQHPPNPDCIPCRAETFSDELDSAPCHSCQRCAEHEIVAAQCTDKSNRICNGTCEAGYFYSKKDSTHSCKKCSYCCSDRGDEEIPECAANQGLRASKQYCYPRPDKDCSPGSSLTLPTDRLGGTEASGNGGLSSGTIAAIVSGVVIAVIIVALVIGIWLHRTRKRTEANTAAHSYVQHGPAVERTVQYSTNIPQDTVLTVTPTGSHEGLRAGNGNISQDATLLSHTTGPQPSADSLPINLGFAPSNPGTPRVSPHQTPKVQKSHDDSHIRGGTIKKIQEPSDQKVKEGSKVELVFKCKAQGNKRLTYQWSKDGTDLPGEGELGTFVLKTVQWSDFGWYKCVASCKDDSSIRVESSPAELDVVPRDGRRYKCLDDIDLETQDQIGRLLTRKIFGGWRQIAYKYGMNELDIYSLENDPEAGKKTLEYLRSAKPDLTVYDFCKALKEDSVKRLDIVKKLLGHLSVPNS